MDKKIDYENDCMYRCYDEDNTENIYLHDYMTPQEKRDFLWDEFNIILNSIIPIKLVKKDKFIIGHYDDNHIWFDLYEQRDLNNFYKGAIHISWLDTLSETIDVFKDKVM